MESVFDIDEFTAACVGCLDETEPRLAVRELLARTVSQPREVAERLQPETAGITLLYNAPDLTVIDVVWAPHMRLFAHDHRMWAALAIYSGQESNEFYRRAPAPGPGLVASGGKQLDTGEVMLLGDDAIHAVTNPVGVPTGAIHVYGGDFVNQARSQWVPPDLVEEAYDMNVVREQFDRDHQHTSPA